MAAPFLEAGARVATKAVANVDWSGLGKRALAFAEQNAPDAITRANEMIGRATGGKSISQLAESRSPVSQATIVKALFEGGMRADQFAEQVVLTEQEKAQYAALVDSFRQKQRALVDVAQAPKAGDPNTFMDRTLINLDIKFVCTLLGISSDDYVRMLRCVNSHTSDDVEMFQADRTIRGERYM
jgi:hypothetical protein